MSSSTICIRNTSYFTDGMTISIILRSSSCLFPALLSVCKQASLTGHLILYVPGSSRRNLYAICQQKVFWPMYFVIVVCQLLRYACNASHYPDPCQETTGRSIKSSLDSFRESLLGSHDLHLHVKSCVQYLERKKFEETKWSPKFIEY
jgi:hypothetical protein